MPEHKRTNQPEETRQLGIKKENNVYSGFLSQILKFAHSWLSMLITIHWPTYRDFILGGGFWSKEDRWNKSFLALTLEKS